MNSSRKDSDFFKSKQDMYVFALTRTDGATRQNLLKIKYEMYINSSKATQWYEKIRKELDPNDSDSINTLDVIYRTMLGGGYEKYQ